MEKDDTLDETIDDTTVILRDILTNTNGASVPLGEDTITITDPSWYSDNMYDSSVSVDTITLLGSTVTNGNGIYTLNPSSYGSITLSPSFNTLGINGSSIQASNSVSLGDLDATKQKIYIVEPWQSKKPMQIEEGLWVSLEKDLISTDELKKKIMEKLEETNPDVVIKMGINPDNMKLVKSEVNLEINKEFGSK